MVGQNRSGLLKAPKEYILISFVWNHSRPNDMFVVQGDLFSDAPKQPVAEEKTRNTAHATGNNGPTTNRWNTKSVFI